MKIHTDNPYRDIWTAIDYENYEPGYPMGHGKSEEEAVNDLIDQLVNLAYEKGWGDAVNLSYQNGWDDACRKHGVNDDAS